MGQGQQQVGVAAAADVEQPAGADRAGAAGQHERHVVVAVGVAVADLGRHHDAEDVTQQVFVSAWNSRHTLRPDKGTVPGWLVGITRHKVADVHAKRARLARDAQAVAENTLPDESAPPPDDLLATRL